MICYEFVVHSEPPFGRLLGSSVFRPDSAQPDLGHVRRWDHWENNKARLTVSLWLLGFGAARARGASWNSGKFGGLVSGLVHCDWVFNVPLPWQSTRLNLSFRLLSPPPPRVGFSHPKPLSTPFPMLNKHHFSDAEKPGHCPSSWKQLMGMAAQESGPTESFCH